MAHAQISPSRFVNNIDPSRASKNNPTGSDLDTNPFLAQMYQSQALMAAFLEDNGVPAAKVNAMNVNDMQYNVSLLVEAGAVVTLPAATVAAGDPSEDGEFVGEIYVNTSDESVHQWDGADWQEIYDGTP